MRISKLVSLFAGAGGLALAATAWAAPPPDTSVPDECRPYLNAADATNVPPECRPYCTPMAAPSAPETPAYAAPEPPPVAAAPVPKVKRARRHNKVFSPWETALTTGAGTGNYFGSGFNAMANADAGAAWDARLLVGTRSIVAFEAGYVGSINKLEVGNGAKEGHLNSNGFDADLRINILPFRVQPYVFGGVGYAHLHVDNANANPEITSRLHEDVDQFTVPAGGGVAAYLGKHATIDLRGTYRLMPDNRLTMSPTGGLTGDSIHQWTASARLGYAF